jgi:hypothetical protein
LICDQGKIAEYRDDITEAIRDNTKRLDQLGMLVEENRDYMHGLDKRQKNLVTYFSHPATQFPIVSSASLLFACRSLATVSLYAITV